MHCGSGCSCTAPILVEGGLKPGKGVVLCEQHADPGGASIGVLGGHGVVAVVACGAGSGMCVSCRRLDTAVGWIAAVGSSTGLDAVPVDTLLT